MNYTKQNKTKISRHSRANLNKHVSWLGSSRLFLAAKQLFRYLPLPRSSPLSSLRVDSRLQSVPPPCLRWSSSSLCSQEMITEGSRGGRTSTWGGAHRCTFRLERNWWAARRCDWHATSPTVTGSVATLLPSMAHSSAPLIHLPPSPLHLPMVNSSYSFQFFVCSLIHESSLR